MAKQRSIFKIEGTLDDVTFYKTSTGGYLVRTKGGINRDRILNDPNFVRTRENMGEFAHVVQTAKGFRQAMATLVSKAKDGKMHNRLMSLLSKLKKEDTVSDRGKRKVHLGIQQGSNKLLFKGFDFNRRATLSHVLLRPIELDSTTGKIEVANFVPIEDLNYPEGATHVSFTSAVLNYDFASAISDLQISNEQILTLDMNSQNINVQPAQMPQGAGLNFYMVLVAFYQQVNGKLYSLRNGAYNVLHILEVV